jgi:hypothetical protein
MHPYRKKTPEGGEAVVTARHSAPSPNEEE